MTRLPASTPRLAKSATGTSGSSLRRSTTTSAANSTADAASSPSTSGWPNPNGSAAESADTRATSAEVTRAAPGRSSRPRAVAASARTRTGIVARTRMPTGTLTKNTACQPNAAVSTPPSSTPAALPMPATAPQMPSALARSDSVVNRRVTRASEAGASSAADAPCRARATSSTSPVGASPAMTEAAVKPAMPARKSRRWPWRSARRPPSSRRLPNGRTYAVMTHVSAAGERPRSVPMLGIAMFTMEASSTTRNCASASTASAHQRRRSGGGVAAVPVGCRSSIVVAVMIRSSRS